jgi:hypothetical protein
MTIISALLVIQLAASYHCDIEDAGARHSCHVLHQFDAVMIAVLESRDTRAQLETLVQTVESEPELIWQSTYGINAALKGRIGSCKDAAITITLEALNRSEVLKGRFGEGFKVYCDFENTHDGYIMPITLRTKGQSAPVPETPAQ